MAVDADASALLRMLMSRMPGGGGMGGPGGRAISQLDMLPGTVGTVRHAEFGTRTVLLPCRTQHARG